jgi:hypothetical protein
VTNHWSTSLFDPYKTPIKAVRHKKITDLLNDQKSLYDDKFFVPNVTDTMKLLLGYDVTN